MTETIRKYRSRIEDGTLLLLDPHGKLVDQFQITDPAISIRVIVRWLNVAYAMGKGDALDEGT